MTRNCQHPGCTEVAVKDTIYCQPHLAQEYDRWQVGHSPGCPRLQFWDAGDHDAACECNVCEWCGEWLDDDRAVRTEVGDMHPECVDDAMRSLGSTEED